MVDLTGVEPAKNSRARGAHYQQCFKPIKYLLSQTLIFSNKMSSVIDAFFICLIMAHSP